MATRDGMTLVEVLLVVAALGILATAAIVLLSDGYTERAASEAARRVANDIELMRHDAVAHRSSRAVAFDSAAVSYVALDGPDTLVHPTTRMPFIVRLPVLFPGQGIAFGELSFGGSDTLTFDRDGLPGGAGLVEVTARDSSSFVVRVNGAGRIVLDAR